MSVKGAMKVHYPAGDSEIRIAPGAFDALSVAAERALIVTDDGVPAAYAKKAAALCRAAHIVTLPAGERSKSMTVLEQLLTLMLEKGFTRGDAVVSVGGGMVSDIAGLTAALYMRGVALYHVPTTLLAMADAAVGGKTAVDLCGVKNAVGSFYIPKQVVIYPETLKTLPERQYSAGMAEIIKIAATSDKQLFSLLEASAPHDASLTEILFRAVEDKKNVVEKDPQEKGLRRVLNFGHTVGHALESAMEGKLLHGECVAAGMLPFAKGEVRERIRRLLEKYRLPTAIPVGKEALEPFLLHDKKAGKEGIVTVEVEEIGSFRFVPRTAEEILALTDDFRKDRDGKCNLV